MADFELAMTGSSSRATVELYAEEPDADVREVRVLLVPPAEGAVPLDLKAAPAGDMRWETDVPALTAGRWIVRIEARVGDFDLVKMKGAFRVP
jgi:nitrogen fixation protein FixH